MAKNDASSSVANSTGESPDFVSKMMYDMVNGMLMKAGIRAPTKVVDMNEGIDISPPPQEPSSQEILAKSFENQAPGVTYRGFKESPGREGSVLLAPQDWKPKGKMYTGPENTAEQNTEYNPADMNDLSFLGGNIFATKDVAGYPGLKEMAQPAISKWYRENPPEEEWKRRGLK